MSVFMSCWLITVLEITVTEVYSYQQTMITQRALAQSAAIVPYFSSYVLLIDAYEAIGACS